MSQILDPHFTPPTIRFNERKKFQDSNKLKSGSVAEWYTRVKTLALICKFGISLEAFVLNQLVKGLLNFIFETICEDDEKITLLIALKKAMIMDTKSMAKEVKEETAVKKITKKKFKQKIKKKKEVLMIN